MADQVCAGFVDKAVELQSKMKQFAENHQNSGAGLSGVRITSEQISGESIGNRSVTSQTTAAGSAGQALIVATNDLNAAIGFLGMNDSIPKEAKCTLALNSLQLGIDVLGDR